ncbi:MAG: beta-propeller domain-containing protein [Thaumarchaeota archaeon]|nr:beta-propeller domain-containing protein [Nitrososphaerota archaeon]
MNNVILAVIIGIAAIGIGAALVLAPADPVPMPVVEPPPADIRLDNGTSAEPPVPADGDAPVVAADPIPLSPAHGTEGALEITTREQLADVINSASLQYRSEGWWQAGMGSDMMMFARSDVMMGASEPAMMFDDAAETADGGVGGTDYSTTNVQVEGVDEPDYVKNDGQYAYVAARNMLTIVDVWPASDMGVVAKVALDIDPDHIRDMFLNGDDLVVFYTSQSDDLVIPEYDFEPRRSYKPVTHAVVLDVSDRSAPEIRTKYSIDGWFEDARMIGDSVYVVATSHVDHDRPDFPIILRDSEEVAPRVFYFDDEWNLSTFTTLAEIDLSGGGGGSISSETFLMGNTGTYYVTRSYFYLTYLQSVPPGYNYEQAAKERFFEAIVPLLPAEVQRDILDAQEAGRLEGSRGQWQVIAGILGDYYNGLGAGERDRLFERIQDALISYDSALERDRTKTVIHKVSIGGEGGIEYVARGAVPGRLLNQFSLGESGGGDRLRVATTTEYYTEYGGFSRSNGVYALDHNLEEVGSLEGVAPDESIYSARFMGDRLYLVTFQQVDPFFVIDISGDTPRILGELKIPGFSNYLHPYDENHVIGVGRDTTLEDDRWVRQLGLKIALFDVSDVSNPSVSDDLIIGDSETYSDALSSHKAFFFDGARDILSMPVKGPYGDLGDTLHPSESENVIEYDDYYRDYWSGFYVLEMDAEDGIGIRGTVSHSAVSADPLPYADGSARTFYIEDVLYTISDGAMVASDTDSLERLGFVRLAGTGALVGYLD